MFNSVMFLFQKSSSQFLMLSALYFLIQTFNKRRRLSSTLLWRDLRLGERVPVQSFAGILPGTVFLFIISGAWTLRIRNIRIKQLTR